MQPTPFTRNYSFTDFQAENPSDPLPAAMLDAELDHISETLSANPGGVLGNLALIQRDDGQLKNDIVTVDAIDDNVLLAIAAAVIAHTKGAPGENAPPPNFTLVVNTLPSGSEATIALTGSYPDLTLTFGLPRGPSGVGSAGATLANGDYGDVLAQGDGEELIVQAVNGQLPSFPGHGHAIADIAGLQLALDSKITDGAIAWSDITDPPAAFPPSAHGHAIANVLGLAEALDAKQDEGAYATTAQLALKADALTTVNSFAANQAVADADHNNKYNRMTGSTGRSITFGSTPSAGHCSLWVNRGTVNMTIVCAGGYYKDGAAATATANFVIAPGDKLTAFHEGGGVWTFEIV